MPVRVKYDHTDQFIDRMAQAFQYVIDSYGYQLQRVFYEKRQWPEGFGKTYRRNGEIVEGSYRNIIDLENAATSQQVELVHPFRANFKWDGNNETPMVIVHEGATLKNGGVIPPRPFTELAAIELDLPQTFVEGYRYAS